MPKFRVTWQVIYSAEAEIEAETKEQAIEIARTTSDPNQERTFLECDYYDAEEITEE